MPRTHVVYQARQLQAFCFCEPCNAVRRQPDMQPAASPISSSAVGVLDRCRSDDLHVLWKQVERPYISIAYPRRRLLNAIVLIRSPSITVCQRHHLLGNHVAVSLTSSRTLHPTARAFAQLINRFGLPKAVDQVRMRIEEDT